MADASIQRYRDGKRRLLQWREPKAFGGAQRKWLAASERQARFYLVEVRETLTAGQCWVPPDQRAVVGLVEMMRAHLDEVQISRSQGTWSTYRAAYRVYARWLEGQGIPTTADTLSRSFITRYVAHLQREGRSERTVALYGGSIGRLWKWACRHPDYRDHVDIDSVPPLPRPAPKRSVAPSMAQMDAAVAAAWAWNDWRGRLHTIMRYTGLRVAKQAARLTLEHADFTRCGFHLTADVVKTRGEIGFRPASPHLFEEMRTWEFGPGPRARLVGVDAPDPVSCRKRSDRVWQSAGVDPGVWSGKPNHAYRHGLKTFLQARGTQDRVCDIVLGHATDYRGGYVDWSQVPGVREAVDSIPRRSQVELGRVVSIESGR